MSVHEFPKPTETFLDRWGHWVLWMGPYILIVALLAWTPRLILLMVGIELVQFIVHVVRYHPEHPMAQTPPFFAAAITLIFSFALIPVEGFVWLLALVGAQVGFSYSVHRWIHRYRTDDVFGRGKTLIDLVGFLILSAVIIVLMIGDGDVPGFPLLRAFLL